MLIELEILKEREEKKIFGPRSLDKAVVLVVATGIHVLIYFINNY